MISEIERRICIELCEKAEAMVQEFFSLERQFSHAETMKGYLETVPTVGKFEKPGGYQLKFAVPQDVHHLLRMAKPDGMADYEHNYDFMRHLQKKCDYMKLFPLADKPWEDIAEGVSQAGAPKTRTERAALAERNATVLDEFGRVIPAQGREPCSA